MSIWEVQLSPKSKTFRIKSFGFRAYNVQDLGFRVSGSGLLSQWGIEWTAVGLIDVYRVATPSHEY